MSTDVGLLKANVGPYVSLFNSEQSVWVPNAYPSLERLAMVAQQRVIVPPVTVGNSYGQQYTFQINQQVPEIYRMTLELALSGVTVTGGTYLLFCDAFLQYLVQNVEFKDPNYGTIQNYMPDYQYQDWLMMKPAQQQQYAAQTYLNQPDGVRATLAKNGCFLTYPFPSWFQERFENTLRAQNIDVPLNIVVTLNNLNSLLQTDGSNPLGTITSMNLVFWGRIPTEAERNTTAEVINSEAGQLMQIRDPFEFEAPQIPIGTIGTVAIAIDAIKGPVTDLLLFFRPWSGVHGNTGSPLTNDYTNFDPTLKPQSIYIQTGNEYVLQPIWTNQLLTDYHRDKFPCCYSDQSIVRISFAEFPQKWKSVNSGYLDFNYLGKPVIYLYFPAATTQNISLYIMAVTNVFIQHQGGTLRAVTSQ